MIKAFHVFSIGFFFVAVLGCEPGRNIDFYRRGHLPPGGSQKQGALGSIGMTLVGFESFETSERSEMSISLYLYSRTRQQQDLLAEWVLVAKDRKVLQKGEGTVDGSWICVVSGEVSQARFISECDDVKFQVRLGAPFDLDIEVVLEKKRRLELSFQASGAGVASTSLSGYHYTLEVGSAGLGQSFEVIFFPKSGLEPKTNFISRSNSSSGPSKRFYWPIHSEKVGQRQAIFLRVVEDTNESDESVFYGYQAFFYDPIDAELFHVDYEVRAID